jgi:hypothetical protein
MSDSYTTIGQSLYDFMEELDISEALPEPEDPEAPAPTWGVKLNRLPKSDEIHVYPAFAITPVHDIPPETGDTDTDFDTIFFSILILVSAHSGDEAETQLRALADIVRTGLRVFRANPAELHQNAHNMSFSGEWGGSAEQGERWYRIDVTTNLYETLISE